MSQQEFNPRRPPSKRTRKVISDTPKGPFRTTGTLPRVDSAHLVDPVDVVKRILRLSV